MNDGQKHVRLASLITETWNEAELRGQARRMGVAASLPGGGVSLEHLTDEFVDLLRRRGIADGPFFEAPMRDPIPLPVCVDHAETRRPEVALRLRQAA